LETGTQLHVRTCSSEITEQRNGSLETDRQLHAQYGQITHTDFNLSAFHYDFNYNYSIHPSVVIGKMDKLCKCCKTLKFQNEAPDMCWAGGR